MKEGTANEEDESKRRNKRLKLDGQQMQITVPTTRSSLEDKENIMQQLVRRSSCVFGLVGNSK